MQSKTQLVKRYLLASDFDQTLSFHDSGLVLSELVGIPAREFERKTAILSVQNLVQQGGELAYLLLRDPEYRSRVRKEHLAQLFAAVTSRLTAGSQDAIALGTELASAASGGHLRVWSSRADAS